tara:strand:- start:52 stop:618 length:567 start_codon:yes stop_codon:yes gene_type:complete
MTPVQQIKQHALDNYNNGWDYIVECYTDAEIQEEYLDACGGDVTKAIALIQEGADYRNEKSEEARQEIESNTDTEEETRMTKQVNYGLHETIKDSHRTLSDAVTLYAIYFSDYGDVLKEISQYQDSDEWANAPYIDELPRYIELQKKQNAIIRELHAIGKDLRSVGIDVDLGDHAKVDEYYESLEVAA